MDLPATDGVVDSDAIVGDPVPVPKSLAGESLTCTRHRHVPADVWATITVPARCNVAHMLHSARMCVPQSRGKQCLIDVPFILMCLSYGCTFHIP